MTVPFAVFYSFGGLSIVLSIWVVWSLQQLGMNNGLSILVMCLQLTLLFQELFSFPFIYLEPTALCQATAALKQYFTLCNLMVNCYISYFTYSMIFTSNPNRFTISKLSRSFLLLMPIVMLIPIAAYGSDDTDTWCTFKNDSIGKTWNIVRVVLSQLFNIPAVAINVYVVVKLARGGSQNYGILVRVVRGSSLYCFVTVGLWIPKLFTINFGSTNALSIALETGRFCTFFAGIAYFLIFVFELSTMLHFEKEVQVGDGGISSSHSGISGPLITTTDFSSSGRASVFLAIVPTWRSSEYNSNSNNSNSNNALSNISIHSLDSF